MTNNEKNLLKKAKELGAIKVKLIPARTIVAASWVRLKCQYGCGVYGQRLTCPPHSPSPEETAKVIGGYSKAILMESDKSWQMRYIVSELEKEAFFLGYYRAFGMGCGPCGLCESCSLEEGCRHPYEARPSMEACGIDVFATARANGFDIETLRRQDEQAKFFGLVLLE